MSRFVDLVSKPARDLGSDLAEFPTTSIQSSKPLIKLDSNENPFGPSPRAMEALRVAMMAMHLYPDDNCIELRRVLAVRHGLLPEQVLVTPGSTGMLSLLCQTLLGPGRNAVTSAVSFILYTMVVRAAGAQLIKTPLLNNGFDLDAILKAITPDTRLVLVANPNNPTGTMLDADAIDRFLARVPPHVVVVLDEAYCDYAQYFATLRNVEYSKSLDYVRRGANVVVLRTFSKAHGLAGLRIGYGMGPAELLGYCARMANTYFVSSVAQAAALTALDDGAHVEHAVSSNTEQAQILYKELSTLGYRVIPTAANFVCFDVGKDTSGLATRLRKEGVSVRPLGAWGAPNCIRVTVGTPEQNQIFLTAMRKLA